MYYIGLHSDDIATCRKIDLRMQNQSIDIDVIQG